MAQNHLVIPQTFQTRFIFAGEGGLTSWNVVTHSVIPDGSPVDVNLANAILQGVAGLWNTTIGTFCATTTTFAGLRVRDLRSANLAEIPSSVGGASGTAGAGDNLPLNIASCFTVRTGRAGRQFRGRSFWAGYTEDANGANGRMAAAFVTQAEAFAAGLITAHNKLGTQLGVAHRPTVFDPTTGLPIAPGLGFTTPAILVELRDDRWDSQRRRNR